MPSPSASAAPQDSEPLVIAGSTPGVCQIGIWQNITVVCWVGPPTASAVNALGETTQTLMDERGLSQLSNIHLIATRVRLPSAETRDALAALTRRFGARTACVGVVLDGPGFWSSAIRGLVTGVVLLAPGPFILRVHSCADELLQWFPGEHGRRTGTTLDLQGLRECLMQAQTWVNDARSLAPRP